MNNPDGRDLFHASDDEWVLVSERVHPRDAATWALPQAVRRLIDSLDRQPQAPLSANVRGERETVRTLLETLGV